MASDASLDPSALTASQREAQKREIEDLLFSKLLGDENVQKLDDAELEDSLSAERIAKISTLSVEDDARSVQSDLTLKRRRFATLRSTSTSRVEAARRELEADRELLGRHRSVAADVLVVRSSPRTTRRSSSMSVVIVGSRRTGKTMITDRLLNTSFRLVPKPTVGVERHDADLDGQSFRIWDTSGDSRFDEAALGLTRTAAAIVAVYRCGDADTFSAAADHLLRARCDTPEAALALVATKLGEAADDSDLESRAARLARSTSAAHKVVDLTDRDGVLDIFRTLRDDCKQRATKSKDVPPKPAHLQDEHLSRLTNQASTFTLALFFIVLVALALPTLPPGLPEQISRH